MNHTRRSGIRIRRKKCAEIQTLTAAAGAVSVQARYASILLSARRLLALQGLARRLLALRGRGRGRRDLGLYLLARVRGLLTGMTTTPTTSISGPPFPVTEQRYPMQEPWERPGICSRRTGPVMILV